MVTVSLQPAINPLTLSQQLLATLGTQVHTKGQTQAPDEAPVLVVSNHRSFMDVAVLMTALDRPIHFACHHYMRQVPLMNHLVDQLGFLPLDQPNKRCSQFFDRATQLLQEGQAVGIFPEGATPMVQETSPNSMSKFQRGFAHLALRTPIANLTILPVAIAARQELNTGLFPVSWLQLFDPSEPLFQRPDWHPLVLYHQVEVTIGRPIHVNAGETRQYRGKQALDWVNKITENCHQEIHAILTKSQRAYS